MKINMIRDNCLNRNLIQSLTRCFQSQNYAIFCEKTQIPAKLLRFFQRKFVVRLVEVFLDVLVLVGNLGPHLNGFLDSKNAALDDAHVFTEAVVDGS